MVKIFDFEFEKKGEAEFEMVRKEKGADVIIFAKEALLRQMDEEVFIQAKNVSMLPGLIGPVAIMPDAHSGYGAPIGTVFAMDEEEGYVSPGAVGYDINCGMRLLRTNLSYDDIKPQLEKIVNLLFNYVPAGVGRKGFLTVSRQEFKMLVEEGVAKIVKMGFGWREDVEKIEARGKIEGADMTTVSNHAVDRGLKQLATLGSGNHYLEIQKVADILDKKKADLWGIKEKNQIVIMIHCGSRGFGHQICTDYLRIFKKHLPEFKVDFADIQLISAPVKSKLAKDYLAAMAAAANFAFVNRQAITYRVRKAFEQVLGKKAEDLDLKIIYDVAHNIGQFEEHQVPSSSKRGRFLIHRKGATRAFPNQPVIIGGSMETGSYLLSGTEGAMKKTYGSTAHGSGRTMSRTKAKKMFRGENLLQKMKQEGIYVKSASFAGLAEEAGFAYKNISDVVKSVDQAGISKPVAYLKPIGNIKG